MKKPHVNELLRKYQPVIKKTGKQLSDVLKIAEDDISKMYKIAQTYVEMQMKNIQKEKLYHIIGKDVAERIIKGKLDIPELEKYKNKLITVNSAGARMKKKLSRIGKIAKTKRTSKSRKKKK